MRIYFNTNCNTNMNRHEYLPLTSSLTMFAISSLFFEVKELKYERCELLSKISITEMLIYDVLNIKLQFVKNSTRKLASFYVSFQVAVEYR